MYKLSIKSKKAGKDINGIKQTIKKDILPLLKEYPKAVKELHSGGREYELELKPLMDLARNKEIEPKEFLQRSKDLKANYKLTELGDALVEIKTNIIELSQEVVNNLIELEAIDIPEIEKLLKMFSVAEKDEGAKNKLIDFLGKKSLPMFLKL